MRPPDRAATQPDLQERLRPGAGHEPPLSPGAVPNYELLQFIKSGGFGDVWLARERVTGVRRAVKFIHKDDTARASRDIEGVRRYQHSAHNHPHLLQILTVGETERYFYYVMEPADNRLGDRDSYEATTLRNSLSLGGRMNPEAALRTCLALVDATAKLHAGGLAHYDLKPENILIVQGEPKIADVGLVAALDAGAPCSGTPDYMTPDGGADDRYALGKVLYEMISGLPAAEFPRLPAELLSMSTAVLRAAIAIVNQACNPQPTERFGGIAEMRRELAAALSRRRTIHSRWVSMSPRTRVATIATTVVLAFTFLAATRGIYSHYVPTVVAQRDLPIADPEALKFIELRHRDVALNTMHALLTIPDRGLLEPGLYELELTRPCKNFVFDFHLRCLRPWGGELAIGVFEDADGHRGARATLNAQPDGTGLVSALTLIGVSGDALTEPSVTRGHPQPGVEYVVRLARVRDGVALALWPLAQAIPRPEVLVLPINRFEARYLRLQCRSYDPAARIELIDVRQVVYSAPIPNVDAFPPSAAQAGIVAAYLPPLRSVNEILGVNLLADEFHPYDSGLWTSIGGWSWWDNGGRDERDHSRLSPIACVPFGSQVREDVRKKNEHCERVFAGFQFLRLDAARIEDFNATVRVNVANSAAIEAEPDPFVTDSTEGSVGLAIRFQDNPKSGYAWGACYAAFIIINPSTRTGPVAELDRYSGLYLAPRYTYAVTSGADGAETLAKFDLDTSAYDQILDPEGFTLTVCAEGGRFEMYLNDDPTPILTVNDPNPLPAGRVALYASRLFPTFESLVIESPPDRE